MNHSQNPRAKEWNDHLKCAEWFRSVWKKRLVECEALQLLVNVSVQLGLFSYHVALCPRGGTVCVMSHKTIDLVRLSLLWCHSPPLCFQSAIPWWCSNLYQSHKMVKGEWWDCSAFKDTQRLTVLGEFGAERLGKMTWILGRGGNQTQNQVSQMHLEHLSMSSLLQLPKEHSDPSLWRWLS